MAVSLACPISGNQRDNNVARVVAGFSLLIAAVVVLIAQFASVGVAALISGLLTIDFAIRAFFKPKYSPLATVGRALTSGLGLKPKMVDGAPKIFAARIGFLFTISSTLLFALGQAPAASVVLGILVVCAFLESAFSFCLGCWVYSILPKGVASALSKGIN
ncbi:MAG: DUF4395 domain-containing protein [Coriobacteriales bacterium]|nr:DUF4395 domain-containing protein [Coriobacteriales bacterium]